MNRHIEKLWLGWGLAALLGLLLLGSTVGGQNGVKPLGNWLEIGPQELQPENLGTIFAGPQLAPGPHMVWIAAKTNDTLFPYSMWRSYGPFEVAAGQPYLVNVSGSSNPVVRWRAWDTRLLTDPNSLASVSYLNQMEGDATYGIMIVPVVGPTPNMVINATLTSADLPEPRHQCPHKVHEVFLDQGKTYVLEMRSDDFDTYLMLEDGEGALLAQNDDDSTVLTAYALNSRIAFQPPTTGTYRLIASAFHPAGEGNYTILGREVPVIMSIEDQLVESAETHNDCFCKTYDVTLTAGRRYYIDLESGAFATYVKLLSQDGTIVAFDEGGGSGLNTRIAYQAPATGTYRLVATSFAERSLGDFSLTVREDP